MRAVVLSDQGLSFQADYEAVPRERMVEVRVKLAGICETDLQLVQGYMGFRGVLGHEFVGIAQSGKFHGQRVVGEINAACFACPTCWQGLITHCPNRSVLGILNHDGAFSDSLWLPEENLHAVPENVSDEEAVFVEPLAAAFQIPAQVDLSHFQKIVVLGDGRLGNLCAQTLAVAGCDPLVIGKHDHKVAKLKRLGLRAQKVEESAALQRTIDLVVDCTGSSSGFQNACRLLKPRGTIILKTTVAGDSGPNLAPAVIDELTVIGSRCGPFAPAIAALSRKEISVAELITSRFQLEDAVQAFECARQKDQLKVLLQVF